MNITNVNDLNKLLDMKFLASVMTQLNVTLLPDILTAFGQMNITQLADLNKLLDMKFVTAVFNNLTTKLNISIPYVGAVLNGISSLNITRQQI